MKGQGALAKESSGPEGSQRNVLVEQECSAFSAEKDRRTFQAERILGIMARTYEMAQFREFRWLCVTGTKRSLAPMN